MLKSQNLGLFKINRLNSIIFLIFLGVSTDVNCQSIYEAWFKKYPNGIHKEYHKNDSLSVLLIKNNGLIETYNAYYPNGQIYFEHYYKNGKAIGIHTGYTIDGRKIDYNIFDNDTLKYCEKIQYYDSKLFGDNKNKNIRKKITWSYQDDYLTCPCFKDELIGEKSVKIIEMQGKKEFYYKDGTLKKQGFICNEKKKGNWEYYDVNGTLTEIKYH